MRPTTNANEKMKVSMSVASPIDLSVMRITISSSILLSYVLLDDVEQRFTVVSVEVTCPADEAVNAFFSCCFQLA